MGIIDQLKFLTNNYNDARYTGLYSFFLNIESSIKAHLELISECLPEFDCHDMNHSYRVIHIIEQLIGNKLPQFNVFELFFLYGSCLLHDCAMAIPAYEMKVLIACEGFRKKKNLGTMCGLDGEKRIGHSKMRTLLEKNRTSLYGSFSRIADAIFCFDNENELLDDLASRACAYQVYRNGFYDKLVSIARSDTAEYKRFNTYLRTSFIRDTHAERSRKYIKNLKKFFPKEIYGNTGGILCDDLGLICLGHGLPGLQAIEKELGGGTHCYFGTEEVSLVFLSLLLRLGDILHFSMDRAPLTLYAEKEGVWGNPHWRAKLQGLDCNVTESENGQKVSFSAACDDPDLYYFIQQYICSVEQEIDNYNEYLSYSSKNSLLPREELEKFNILLSRNVDHHGLRPIGFYPAEHMCFTMDQQRILDLLMGVQLYHDKFACLRELYQNSLDACRCIAPIRKGKGKITFGLGCENDHNNGSRPYLFCLDNGIGMTREIIENHFLKIGNSYYTSSKFKRENIDCGNRFSPISQFGIGILSCFMICDSIEITTRHYKEQEALRFYISGPHKQFYFIEPDSGELEDFLPNSGTLIKLYLTKDVYLDATVPALEDYAEIFLGQALDIMSSIRYVTFDECDRTLYDGRFKSPKYNKNEYPMRYENNIIFILSRFISYSNKDVNVIIESSNGKKILLPSEGESIDSYCHITKIAMWRIIERHFIFYDKSVLTNAKETFLNNYGDIFTKHIQVSVRGTNYCNIIQFPKCGHPIPFELLCFSRATQIQPMGYLVDGLRVSLAVSNTIWGTNLNDNNRISGGYLINFCGIDRPILSVDRQWILEIPDRLKKDLILLKCKIVKYELKIIKDYFVQFGIADSSIEAHEFWLYYFRTRSWLNIELIKELSMLDFPICFDFFNRIFEKPINIKSLLLSKVLYIKDLNLGDSPLFLAQVLTYKLSCANIISIQDELIIAENFDDGCQKSMRAICNNTQYHTLNIVLRADKWEGKFSEFDITTSHMPIIGNDLFELLAEKTNLNRYRNCLLLVKEDGSVYRRTNELGDFYNISSCDICPERGIIYRTCGCRNRIYTFTGNRWEFNISHTIDPDCNYFIFLYVCPARLTKEEERDLQNLKGADPIYYRGVTEGWSVMILDQEHYIYSPGILPKADMLKKIPMSFWLQNKGKPCRLTDGTLVTEITYCNNSNNCDKQHIVV